MKLTIEKNGEIVKAVKAEYTPAEYIIVENAMHRYAKNMEVGVIDRLIMQQMLLVVPVKESEDAE